LEWRRVVMEAMDTNGPWNKEEDKCILVMQAISLSLNSYITTLVLEYRAG